ncbi:MAG: hypothetical protein LDLANPLL_01256 [Turneriella sp.]|nr:hypothetical protein [Turneriella sp.]
MFLQNPVVERSRNARILLQLDSPVAVGGVRLKSPNNQSSGTGLRPAPEGHGPSATQRTEWLFVLVLVLE